MFFLKYQFPEVSCFPERKRIWREDNMKEILKKNSYHETERGRAKKKKNFLQYLLILF